MTIKPASKTLSVRLTPEERLRLELEAGNQPVSTYARLKLLDGQSAVRKVRGRAVIKDHESLGRVLGMLGTSHLAASIRTLAKAVETGNLPVTPETAFALKTACGDIRAMRDALMKALGFRCGGPKS